MAGVGLVWCGLGVQVEGGLPQRVQQLAEQGMAWLRRPNGDKGGGCVALGTAARAAATAAAPRWLALGHTAPCRPSLQSAVCDPGMRERGIGNVY